MKEMLTLLSTFFVLEKLKLMISLLFLQLMLHLPLMLHELLLVLEGQKILLMLMRETGYTGKQVCHDLRESQICWVKAIINHPHNPSILTPTLQQQRGQKFGTFMCSCNWASCCRERRSCCLWNSAMRSWCCTCCLCLRVRSSCSSCRSRHVPSTAGLASTQRSMGMAAGGILTGRAELSSTAGRKETSQCLKKSQHVLLMFICQGPK